MYTIITSKYLSKTCKNILTPPPNKRSTKIPPWSKWDPNILCRSDPCLPHTPPPNQSKFNEWSLITTQSASTLSVTMISTIFVGYADLVETEIISGRNHQKDDCFQAQKSVSIYVHFTKNEHCTGYQICCWMYSIINLTAFMNVNKEQNSPITNIILAQI